MFYVHLFLEAMYRKREKKKKINFVFPKPAFTYAWQLELQKAVASYVKRGRANAARKKTRAEVNSERERLTGSMLKSIPVNIARTTARKLIYCLKRFP